MALTTVTMRIKVSWWLKVYLYGVSLMCGLTGKNPDWAKVDRVIRAGVTMKMTEVK